MKAQNSLTAQTGNGNQTFSTFITGDAIANRINQMVASKEEGTQFIASLVAAVTTTPALQECTHMSILNCGLQCLALKLSPTPQLGQFYFLPFKDNNSGTTIATPAVGYKGLVQLCIRSGYYKRINVLALRQGELKKWNPLTEEIDVSLIEDDEKREQTPIAGFYAMFEYTSGFSKALYWSDTKMKAYGMRYSPSFKKDIEKKEKNTLWSTDYEAMGCKSILRQLLSKWGIMSIEMQKAFEIDKESYEAGSFVESAPAKSAEDEFFDDKKSEEKPVEAKVVSETPAPAKNADTSPVNFFGDKDKQ